MAEIAAEPSTQTITAEKMQDSMAAFDAIESRPQPLQGLDPANPAVIEQPAKTEKQPEKTPPAKSEKAGDSKIPESLITGLPDVKKERDPNEEPDLSGIKDDALKALLTEKPTSHITHAKFKEVQKGAAFEVARVNSELAALKAEQAAHSQNGNGKLPEHIEKEIADIKAQKAELETELKRVAYERSPEFREKYLSREKATREQLTTISKELGIEAGTLDAALAMPYKRRAEAVDGLEIPESAKGDLLAVMREHDRIQGEKKDALEKSGEQIEAMEREHQARQKEHAERLRKEDDAIFEEVLKESTEKYLPLRRVDGNDAWNKQGDELRAEAKLYWNGQVTPKQAAEVTIAGLALRPTMEILKLTQERLKSVMEENQKLRSSNPGGGGSAPGVKADESGLSKEELASRTYDRMQETMKQNGGFGGGGVM